MGPPGDVLGEPQGTPGEPKEPQGPPRDPPGTPVAILVRLLQHLLQVGRFEFAQLHQNISELLATISATQRVAQ